MALELEVRAAQATVAQQTFLSAGDRKRTALFLAAEQRHRNKGVMWKSSWMWRDSSRREDGSSWLAPKPFCYEAAVGVELLIVYQHSKLTVTGVTDVGITVEDY